MPEITYVDRNFSQDSLQVIGKARAICADYAEQGYDLTLRQLYYQFVSRDLVENTERSYKRLGSIVNDARLAGLLDWDYIVDRTRNLSRLSHWDDPADLIRDASQQFRMDRWSKQPTYVEVWIEKDALVGVLKSACPQEDVPFFSCRGYTSQSEIWGAAQRLGEHIRGGQRVAIIHLGDHDPSGIDMTRDIEERLAMFIAIDEGLEHLGREPREYLDATADFIHVERIALNQDQVEQYKPPPNPAKLTDSRAKDYIRRFGGSSWELDALEPSVLVALIRDQIEAYRDPISWDFSTAKEEKERQVLTAASARWADVKEFLDG